MSRVMLGTVVLGVAIAAVVRASRELVAVTVHGASMQPTYQDGDRLLVHRNRPLKVGRVVVIERPDSSFGWRGSPVLPDATISSERNWMIKRIAALPDDAVPDGLIPGLTEVRVPPSMLLVLGDNTRDSLDSRQIGYVPVERVLGVAVRRRQPRSITRKVSGPPGGAGAPDGGTR